MQRLEVSGAVRPIYGSLGVKRLTSGPTLNKTSNVHKRNIEARSYSLFCSGKATSITHVFRVWFYRLRCSACNAHGPYCHLWPAPLYNIFPHYLIHGLLSKDMIKMCIGLHVKYSLFLSDFKELEFSRQNFEKYTDFIKILPEGAELLHED